MSDYCVYQIDCAATGKAYIGLTKTGARKRFATHCYLALAGQAGALYAAMRKHGVEAFSIAVIEDGLPLELACDREIALIAERGTRTPSGYNIAVGGLGAQGFPASDETRARMSETQRRRQADPELRARTAAALTGREKSPEHLRKIAEALTGRKLSEAAKDKLRAANLGKKQSAETRAKRSEAMRGRPRPEHLRNLLGDATRGKPKSEEHRKKLSDALKGRKRGARAAG